MSKEIIVLTGSKGAGKSTAAAYFARPSEIDKVCVVDTEDSQSEIVKNLAKVGKKFGAYIRLYERYQVTDDLLSRIEKGKLPWVSESQKSALVDYYTWFVRKMSETLTPGKFKYLVIDTVEPIEAGLAAWAEVHRKESGWSGARDHGKLEVEAVRPLYDALLESFAQRGIEHIILTTHLRNVWLNDRPVPGKTEPGGRLALLSRLSTLMVWLVSDVGNEDGAPAGIVLKARKSQTSIDGDEWVIRKPLPQRIPHFSWTDVRRYESEGCDRKNPAAGEVMTAAELEMTSEFLSDTQMHLMALGAETELEQLKANQLPFLGTGEGGFTVTEKKELTIDQKNTIQELLGRGFGPAKIVGLVPGVNIAQVWDIKNNGVVVKLEAEE
jgi:hypothetical protein